MSACHAARLTRNGVTRQLVIPRHLPAQTFDFPDRLGFVHFVSGDRGAAHCQCNGTEDHKTQGPSNNFLKTIHRHSPPS